MLSSTCQIIQQFLCGVPVNKINFADVLDDITDEKNGESNQVTLLSLTVDHPKVLEYPLKVEYQRSFLRRLIKQMEAKNADVSGIIYERHIQLLNAVNGDKVYRHYLLHNGSLISIKESISIISNGTTGLCVWQAAHVLINYCFKNVESFKNSSILELGSGVGLCGIAVSLLCRPSSYIFSDCHPAVINTLVDNVQINSGSEDFNEENDLDGRIRWSGKLGDCTVAVAHLPWEDIVDAQLTSDLAPNFVIASDVVYDPDLFEPLAKALREFINTGSEVILTCTERNSNTLQEFLNKTDCLGLKAQLEANPGACIIPVSDDSVVRVYRLFKKSSTENSAH